MATDELIDRAASRGHRLRAWLGLERNVLVMLASVLLIGAGEELWSRYIPKYLEVLGASVLVIAVYGSLKDLSEALYPYPGGWVTDRLGRRRALLTFAATAIVGYTIYLVFPSWPAVLIGTPFVMAWANLTLPAIFAIIGDTLAKDRRAIGFGVQSIVKRLPIIVAPPIGAWLLARLGIIQGVQVGLVVTIGLALVTMVIVRRAYIEQPGAGPSLDRLPEIWRSMDTRLKRLLVSDCLARWAEGIPKVFIVLFVTDVVGQSLVQFGWLTSLQMIAATLVYIPIAKLSDRMNRKPFVMLTFAFFALFPLVLGLSHGMLGLSIAFAIAGLREIGEPARKAMIVDLAQVSARGRAVGLYYLIRGLVVFPAALVGGWLWTLAPRLPLYVASAVGVVGLVAYGLWGPGDDPTEAGSGGG